MKKIFLVKEWTEGVTSWDNINSETPYEDKEKALSDFMAKRDEADVEDKIIEEEENYVVYEFRDNGATCYGYIKLIEKEIK